VTEDGQPYYAMEYVKGDDLLTYADRLRLDLDARIRLFVQVCEAVHHAHQQLVVHRDLKPSNILVTPEGRPKLLDFGIAKTLESLASGEATAHWVTPAYASPEQLSGGTVGTRSDVFALGVLLCQLLTGLRPFPEVPASAAALVRARTEDGARRPSTLAQEVTSPAGTSDAEASPGADGGGSTTGEAPSPEERAALRATTPARLARRLKNELDLVVLQALAADPERRYDSAAALAADLRRHLEGRPVHARPDSWGYRASKFVARNRALAGVALLLVVVLLAGVVGVAWQARRAADERDRAALEAARAQQVTALMTDIFRLGDPTQALGDTIGVSRVLEEGVRRVEASLGGDPGLQGTLFLELARIYRNLGLLAEAERLGDRALALRETNEPETLAHAEALGFLGLLHRDAGQPARAIERLEAAIALRNRVAEPDTALASLLAGLGWEVRAAGDSDRAGDLFRRALDIQRAALGADAPAVGTSMLGLAASFHDQGAFDEAEQLFRTALEPGRSEASPVVATALVQLGMMTRIREDYREAERYLQAGLEMRSNLFDSDHPAVVEARQEAAADLIALGRYEEAEALLQENLRVGVTVLGADHEATRGAWEGLGTVYHAWGRWEEALLHLEAAMESKRRVRGADHASVVYSLAAIGDLLADAGWLDDAEQRYREALDMGARLGGNEGVYGGLARHGLGRVALVRGDLARADSLVAVARTLFGGLREDHRYMLDLRRTEAQLLMRRDQWSEAIPLLEGVLEAETRVRPSPHPRRGVTQRMLAEAREAVGDSTGAAGAWSAARDEFRALPATHPERRRVAEALGGG
jgi:tetratricopeptide (TPR) repeat protein